ncbi:chemotaxis protein CheA [Gorillibacterium massiliense]|uniref:chemotaxis protein CheA n=1 Tax=Gorillibacterium massiliense TaxID=1280390 RepID=UPI0004B17D0B|nr:chemotaxis protein CheA [Gorillibacterium massiliense]
MSDHISQDHMLDMYLFETTQNLEQLEKSILSSEESSGLTPNAIHEIFRIMHTIKGSSAMMFFDSITTLAHALEDLFYYIREEKPRSIDISVLFDLVFAGVDFMKVELAKIKNGDRPDGDATHLIETLQSYLAELKGDKPKRKEYRVVIRFEDGCEMENIRAYSIVHSLKELTEDFEYEPKTIIESDDSAQIIRESGFRIILKTDRSEQELYDYFSKTLFLKELELEELPPGWEAQETAEKNEEIERQSPEETVSRESKREEGEKTSGDAQPSFAQSIISVQVGKLDKLMDLVGEMVIAEAMVTQNPDLQDLELENFQKAARQLRKISSELQDMVMSIRMVPLSTTFHKMHRVARDMSRKLDKEVQLKLIGEETEVDKNIIEQISDPLMHLVRNSIDHGIEEAADRAARGKNTAGLITLEAKNAGSDVWVTVKDDGKGLSREKILQKAREHGLLYKSEHEMTDREIYQLIFLPGFSTKERVTEFSGRGVGMDVVLKKLESVGGSLSIDSVEGEGTTTTLKIPLTLAIIDGMNIRVGGSRYTLPIASIRESFRSKQADIIEDPDGNEMIIVRGEVYSILRLHELYGVKGGLAEFTEGIFIMIEHEGKSVCLFADELLGQQQVVVKALPKYIKNTKKIEGLAGCTLLGDGSVSLILDIGGLIGYAKK